MKTLQEILSGAGLDLDQRTMIVRVIPDRGDETRVGHYLLPSAFRRTLAKKCKPFIRDCDYVACFIDSSDNDGGFSGNVIFEAVYSVTKNGNLEKHMDFQQLGGYPSFEWRFGESWFAELGTLPVELQFLVPTRYHHSLDPKSDLRTSKSMTMLDEAVRKPYQDWKKRLTKTKGIYQIMDMRTGKNFVGQATESNDMWTEFEDFVKTNGHANYPVLMKLVKNNPDRAYDFSFQIVRLFTDSDGIEEANEEIAKHVYLRFIELTKAPVVD